MARINSRKLSPVAVVILLAAVAWDRYSTPTQPEPVAAVAGETAASANTDTLIEAAFHERRGDYQIEGEGTVVHVLPDDTKGSQHQRFLLELRSGLTLLVAHNIDLAPRVPKLKKGDRVRFYGEYEWNDEGGVIHWTHHDPGGRHPDGWLEHQGRRYE